MFTWKTSNFTYISRNTFSTYQVTLSWIFSDLSVKWKKKNLIHSRSISCDFETDIFHYSNSTCIILIIFLVRRNQILTRCPRVIFYLPLYLETNVCFQLFPINIYTFVLFPFEKEMSFCLWLTFIFEIIYGKKFLNSIKHFSCLFSNIINILYYWMIMFLRSHFTSLYFHHLRVIKNTIM